MALGKTAETLRGLGGALGCNCPSEPRKVTPPPAGTEDGVTSCVSSKVESSCMCAYACVLPGWEGNACRGCGLSRGSLPVRNTGEMGAGLVSSDGVF